LCSAVADATRYTEPFLYNSKLFESERFVVVPSLGPLVPGHVMIVSKEHRESLASMGPAALKEYNDLAMKVRSGPLLDSGEALEAEHGSTPGDKAGACVVHTHVHVIPKMGKHLPAFKERLAVRREARLSAVGPAHEPYIFLRNDSEEVILDAQNLPSQTIRRILCEILDRDDDDWTQAPRLNWVKETVDAWARHNAP
jgi:diadenosine tetraphosphate (Ap4A) HIT family hydrolase